MKSTITFASLGIADTYLAATGEQLDRLAAQGDNNASREINRRAHNRAIKGKPTVTKQWEFIRASTKKPAAKKPAAPKAPSLEARMSALEGQLAQLIALLAK